MALNPLCNRMKRGKAEAKELGKGMFFIGQEAVFAW